MVRARPSTIHKEGRDHRVLAKSFGIEVYRAVPEADLARYRERGGVRRVAVNCDVPRSEAPLEISRQLAGGLVQVQSPAGVQGGVPAHAVAGDGDHPSLLPERVLCRANGIIFY